MTQLRPVLTGCENQPLQQVWALRLEHVNEAGALAQWTFLRDTEEEPCELEPSRHDRAFLIQNGEWQPLAELLCEDPGEQVSLEQAN
jgi:hypothetical protein